MKMPVEIEQFTCRSDNFGILLRDVESGVVALVDAPEEAPILAAIGRTGWRPSLLLVTHHHGDHVEANLALKQRFGLRIVGPAAEAAKIPGIDEKVAEGDTVMLGAQEVRVIGTPGHTAGHVSYHLPEASVAFTGDTLFSLGCGRLFEAGPEAMFASLAKLAALPGGTKLFCGHEYTAANARFALSVDAGNAALQARAKEVESLRAEGRPTLPTTLSSELETNPFLRTGDPAIRKALGMEEATDEAVFAELRRRKDAF
jgi:hydroxyacylglutathione hydrolase